jgi:hypothetical protein
MKTQITSSEYFKTINVISVAMIVGQSLFLAVSLYLNYDGSLSEDIEEFRNVLRIIVPIALISCLLSSLFIFRKKISILKQSSNLCGKMSGYRAALITKYALIEGPSFFGIVAFLITADLYFIPFPIICILIFIIIFPNKKKIANELDLNSSERMRLDNPEEIICIITER